MKLILFFLIFNLIQLWPFASAVPVPTNSSIENLLELYDREFQILAEDFSEKAKNVSEKLKQDKEIQEATTAELKEFQKFLEDFLKQYPHFKRYKIYHYLVKIFIGLSTTAKDEEDASSSEEEDSLQQFKLTMKKYFATPLKEFQQNYEKFLKEKILPKIKDYEKLNKPEELEEVNYLKEIMDKLENCKNYQCFATNINFLLPVFKSKKELIINYSNLEGKRMLLLVSLLANNMSQHILKDPKFSELSLEAQQNVTNDINDFSREFENHTDIEKFWQVVQDKLHYPMKYRFGSKVPLIDSGFPLKDAEILKEIIDKYNLNRDKSKFEMGIKDAITESILNIIFMSLLVPEVGEQSTKFHIN